MTVAVRAGLSAATSFYLSLDAEVDDNNYLEIEMSATQLTAMTVVGGMRTNIFSARMPGEDYLQIREASGTLYYEVSTDRALWRMIDHRPVPFSVADVIAELRGGEDNAGGADSIDLADFGVH